MPIIKSAKKRVRTIRKASIANAKTKRTMRESIKSFQSKASAKKDTTQAQKDAFSAIDTAYKKGIISKNKAARKKSQINAAAKAAGTTKAGTKKAHILVLQGKPLNEPVVKHGPFVMNTEKEIRQALHEYQLTQFGGWPWQYTDNVHPKEKGRFAKYPDGTFIEK